MKTKPEKENIGIYILISALVISYSLYSVKSAPEKIVKYEPLPPCDVFTSGKKDWCDPYIDWGKNNGFVMAKRMLGEETMLASIDKNYKPKSCNEIVNELYEIGHPMASGEIPFLAGIEK